jgi:hypothetical protein
MISREESLLNSAILLGNRETQNGLSQYKNIKPLKYTLNPYALFLQPLQETLLTACAPEAIATAHCTLIYRKRL